MNKHHARRKWEKLAEQLIEITVAVIEVMKRLGLL
jgi:hypothetical protein